MIHNNQINFNDLDISDQNLKKQGQGESFRLHKKADIKIQENMFDDSSHRFSKGRDFYKNDNSQDELNEDSLLNESELNNYFQDQKFSIEDFKSLDKRKIIDTATDIQHTERLEEG